MVIPSPENKKPRKMFVKGEQESYYTMRFSNPQPKISESDITCARGKKNIDWN